MKCHYEILGIARDADDSEIKTAYRKLALRWHPDKNLDNPEEAKEQFQLVQQAYEVLSDLHERAWYDNHREQILRGRNSDYEDSCLDVFQYFTVSCFKGYDDSPNGFYQTYSNVFETIATEDAEFMSEEEFEKIPKFGNSQSTYDDVVGPFYAYWQSYCTKRTYTWLCPYNINEVKDRRILREIEKEMKKIVQKAKRERNEEVRNLVSFVRKRDKRVQAYKKYLEDKALLNRQKQEQNRLERIRKRKQEIDELKKSSQQKSNLNEDYEQQLKQLEQEYGTDSEYDDSESYTDDDDNDENDDVDNSLIESTENLELNDDDELFSMINDLYCIACNKQFKNVNAFQNHEISKKHRENVEKLKKKMIEKDEIFQEYTNSCDDNNVIKETKEEDDEQQNDDNDEEIIETHVIKIKTKKSKKSKRMQNIQTFIHDDDNDGNEDYDDISKERKNADFLQLSDKEDDTNWNESNTKKSNKKSKNKKTNQQQQKNLLNVQQTMIDSTNQIDKTTIAETLLDTEKKSSLSSSKKKNAKDESRVNDIDMNHVCVTCKSTFESKNKLFQHLKKTNHGVYIPSLKTNKPSTSSLVAGVGASNENVTATNRKGRKHK